VELLSSDMVLMIEAPFDPLPLRRLMGRKGFSSYAQPVSEGHWQAFFKQQAERDLPLLPDLPSFPMAWRNGILELDLRGLEPPNPMIAVLKIIENDEGGKEFYARLWREPIYLYPELAERQWQAELISEDEQGFWVRIYKVIEGEGS